MEQKPDTAEHSVTNAPETRNAAEERGQFSDERLRPGGSHGAGSDVGMSGIDRESTPTKGPTEQEDPGEPTRMSER